MPSYKQDEPKKAGTYFVQPGIYPVEIEKAIEKTSQAGNPMIKLDVRVIAGKDVEGPVVWDHLVFTPKASWKIDQFLASIGQAVVPGEEVSIEAEDLVGTTGVALIGEEPGAQNPDARFNTIERWIFGEELAKWKKKKSEEVPF